MSSEVQVIQSEEEFKRCVAQGTVLVDFWAPWCGPCRMQLPVVEEVAKEFAGKATVAKVNVDENEILAEQFKVSSIPALFVFVDGQVVQEFHGVQNRSTLTAALEQAMAHRE